VKRQERLAPTKSSENNARDSELRHTTDNQEIQSHKTGNKKLYEKLLNAKSGEVE
jgi:hypothetical protein